MARYLTVDEGNTATKAALWHDDAVVSREPDFSAPVDAAVIASVKPGSALCERFAPPVCQRLYKVSAHLPLPITLKYDTHLGADRIAAACGAYSVARGRDVLVVDVGTAVTYDFVGSEAVFEGGNIAPGIGLRLRALHHFTAALPEVGLHGPVPLLGENTAEAMRAGAVRGVAAEIEYYARRLRQRHPGLVTILTGGGAQVAAEFLSDPFIIEPHLVMIGLKSILDHNENL